MDQVGSVGKHLTVKSRWTRPKRAGARFRPGNAGARPANQQLNGLKMKPIMPGVSLYASLVLVYGTVGGICIACDGDGWTRIDNREVFGFSASTLFVSPYRHQATDGLSSNSPSLCARTSAKQHFRLRGAVLRSPLMMSIEPSESSPVDERATVFVGNLPWALDSYGLRKLFEPHGKIRIAQISWDDRTDRSRCHPSL